MTDQDIEKQLQASETLVEEANQALAHGQLDDARSLFTQALQALDGGEAVNRGLRFQRMAAQSSVHEALGVVGASANELDVAEEQYGLALQLRRQLLDQGAHEEGFEVTIPRAVTHLNLAGVLGNQERFEEAHQHAVMSVELSTQAVESHEDGEQDPQLDLLLMSGLSSTAMIRAAAGDMDGANEAFDQGIMWARAILTRGLEEEDAGDGEAQEVEVEHLPEFLPNYGQLLLNAAMVRNVTDEYDHALALAEEASQIGQALLEATEAEEALELYINSELGAMQYAAAAGKYGRAEDALFKALALAPGQPELLELGEQFYLQLLERTDAELEAGGLPRDEVQDSLAELRATGRA